MKTLFSFLLITTASVNSFCQDISLKVIIEGIEVTKGTIYLSLHNSEESFPSGDTKAVQTGQIKNFTNKAEFTFTNLRKGEYAVSVFQDLNGNKKLDTNFVGFPKEPVGVSNMNSLGRPKFSKCKFDLRKDASITVKYMN